MAMLTESLLVEASLAETWAYYFEPRGWVAWVDGFAGVESSAGFPQEGSTLVWHSTPAGRGTVSERVLEHQPRRLHRIEFSDPASRGRQLTRFEVEGEATRVTLELDYELVSGGAFAAVTERLFVRSQVRKALQRTLLRFKHEAEEAAHLDGAGSAADR